MKIHGKQQVGLLRLSQNDITSVSPPEPSRSQKNSHESYPQLSPSLEMFLSGTGTVIWGSIRLLSQCCHSSSSASGNIVTVPEHDMSEDSRQSIHPWDAAFARSW